MRCWRRATRRSPPPSTATAGSLLLAGEAGIGKSTLAQAVADRARAAGATCGSARAGRPRACRRSPRGSTPCAGPAAMPAPRWPSAWPAATRRHRRRQRRAGPRPPVRRGGRRPLRGERRPPAGAACSRTCTGPTRLASSCSRRSPLTSVRCRCSWWPPIRDDEMPRPNPLAALGGAAERIAVERPRRRRGRGDRRRRVTGRPPRRRRRRRAAERTGGNPLFVTQMARLLDAGSEAVPAGRAGRARAAPGPRVERLRPRCSAPRRCSATSSTRTVLAALVRARRAAPPSTRPAPLGSSSLRGRPDALAASSTRSCRPRATTACRRREREALAPPGHRRAARPTRGRPPPTLAHHAARARFEPGDADAPRSCSSAPGQEALAGLAWRDATAAFERALAAAPDGRGRRRGACRGLARHRRRPPPAGPSRRARRLRRGRRARPPARSPRPPRPRRARLRRRSRRLRGAAPRPRARSTCSRRPPPPSTTTTRCCPLVLARLSVALAFIGADERRAELAIRAIDLARHAGAGGGPRPRAGRPLRCLRRSRPHRRPARRIAGDRHAGPARTATCRWSCSGRRLRVVALFESLQFARGRPRDRRYERTAAMRSATRSTPGTRSLWRAARGRRPRRS